MNKELEKWFRDMQFMGEIPENFVNICNRSSSFIWDQLIANTRPRQEIEKIRKNIIINRLKTKPLSKQDDFEYSIDEIQRYKKNMLLQNKLKNLEKLINEKRVKDNNVSINNKIKYIMIEILKFKIRINEEREFLLRKKCSLLETNIADFQQLLTSIRNLTPVELDDNTDNTEIMQKLQKCASKLNDYLCKLPVPSDTTSVLYRSNQLSYTSQKTRRNHDTFQKYLTMTERRSSMAISTCKKSLFPHPKTDNFEKITKRLFSDEKQIVSKPFENNTNTRDSLGILSSDDFTFLEFENVQNDTLLSNNSNNSVNSFKTILNESSEDKMLNKSLTDLLHQYNRQIIWNNIINSVEKLHLNIRQTFLGASKNLESTKKVRYEIAQLQMFHVDTEFQILKQKRIISKYLQTISQQKENLYDCLSKQENYSTLARTFERQLERIGLDATLSAMKKEIDSAGNIEENTNLLIVSGKLAKVKEETIKKVNSIKHYADIIEKIFSSIQQTHDRTLSNIRKLGPFISNTSWCTDLTQNLCSSETKTFENLPLDFNGRFVKKIENIDMNYFGTSMDLDQEHLVMLANVLESPFSPPETIVLNILKSKMKLEVLKQTQTGVQIPSFKKYSLEELEKQESYIQFAMDRLNALISSTSCRKSLATEEMAKESMQIWLEMPFKDVIPDERLVEGHSYKFYEKQYDKSYNYMQILL